MHSRYLALIRIPQPGNTHHPLKPSSHRRRSSLSQPRSGASARRSSSCTNQAPLTTPTNTLTSTATPGSTSRRCTDSSPAMTSSAAHSPSAISTGSILTVSPTLSRPAPAGGVELPAVRSPRFPPVASRPPGPVVPHVLNPQAIPDAPVSRFLRTASARFRPVAPHRPKTTRRLLSAQSARRQAAPNALRSYRAAGPCIAPPSLRSRRAPRQPDQLQNHKSCLREGAGLKATVLLAVTFMVSPVLGLRS